MASDQTMTRRVGSVMADSMADTLFDQDPPIDRHVAERKLRRDVTSYLQNLQYEHQTKQISLADVGKRLARLDEWLCTRLSGFNALALIREIEARMPEYAPMMPRVIGVRYEQLRVARLWSALLNPDALNRLTTAIAQERAMGDEGDFV